MRLPGIFFSLGVLLVALGTVALGAGAASAGKPDITHEVSHDVVETFEEVIPCGEALYEITITVRTRVNHEMLVSPETGKGHFSETGTFVAEPVDNPSLPTYSGHFSSAGHFRNVNSEPGTADGHFVFNVVGKGSDGSRLHAHELAHGVFDDSEEGALISGFEKGFCK